MFTHKCDTGNLSALIQCWNIVQQIERDCFNIAKRRSIYIYIHIYIYTTLVFLALLGAPYIYDISSLRVNGVRMWSQVYEIPLSDCPPVLSGAGHRVTANNTLLPACRTQGHLSRVSKYMLYLPQYTGWFRTKGADSTGNCERKIDWRHPDVLKFQSFSILSDDRSKASSKTMPPHSAIYVRTETCSLTHNKAWCVWRKLSYHSSIVREKFVWTCVIVNGYRVTAAWMYRYLLLLVVMKKDISLTAIYHLLLSEFEFNV